MGGAPRRHPQDRRRGDPAPRRGRGRHPVLRRARGDRRRPRRGRRPPRAGRGGARARAACAWWWPARRRRRKTIERDRDRARLGVHPDLRAHRDLAAAHHQPGARRSGTALDAGRARAAALAGRRARGRRAHATSTPSGEILARSNHVFEGYWDQPEETGQGPRGRLVPHRRRRLPRTAPYTVIADRKKDVIITGGENVSSIEVEDCLFQHPAVAEVAVIGVPDEKWGETIKALVVLRAGPAGDRARPDRVHCRGRMAHFKCPTVDRVPRRAAAHRDRQAPEVQAARAVLGGPRPPGELRRRG